MPDISFLNFSGLNTVSGFHDEKILSFSESSNVDLYQGSVRRARGQELKVTLPSPVIGMGEHEDTNGFFSLHAICENGTHYRVEPLTSAYTVVKTGLTITTDTKPYFTMFNHTLIVCTGTNDPYGWDGSNITTIPFHTTYSKYPTCSCAFGGRMFYAVDNILAWTAANTIETLVLEGDAGYKDNYNGRILRMDIFSSTMIVATTTDIYLFSGDNNTNWLASHYSNTGVKSRFSITKIDNKLYLWNNGLFPIEASGDMFQSRIADPLTVAIQNSLIDIDTFRLSELMMVPYPDRKQIWIYVPIKNEVGISKCWVINFENYTKNKIVSCYERRGNLITSACQFRGKIYSSDSTGKIYEEDKGNLFGTNPIVAECKFNPIRLGSQRIKSNYEIVQLIMNARSINRFKFTTAYDGDFYDTNEIDVEDITVEDNYYVLNESELTDESVSVVNDYVHTEINILDEWKIIQIGFKCDTVEEDFICDGIIFMDSNINIEY